VATTWPSAICEEHKASRMVHEVVLIVLLKPRKDPVPGERAAYCLI